ncbi:hypothetical protein EVAR_82150_1 [Eumeta japonica]|uniref:Uncharacterized protein n=1 Tax=Eumeta variegata TaxID=151549 RepID=A0A4C1U367_EUMVA|nr:hypothetical protein EVAR_82150_1 [Eumeta japonica]
MLWWDSKGIIHYELLPPGRAINSDLYCQKLKRLGLEVEKKQPELISRNDRGAGTLSPPRWTGAGNEDGCGHCRYDHSRNTLLDVPPEAQNTWSLISLELKTHRCVFEVTEAIRVYFRIIGNKQNKLAPYKVITSHGKLEWRRAELGCPGVIEIKSAKYPEPQPSFTTLSAQRSLTGVIVTTCTEPKRGRTSIKDGSLHPSSLGSPDEGSDDEMVKGFGSFMATVGIVSERLNGQRLEYAEAVVAAVQDSLEFRMKSYLRKNLEKRYAKCLLIEKLFCFCLLSDRYTSTWAAVIGGREHRLGPKGAGFHPDRGRIDRRVLNLSQINALAVCLQEHILVVGPRSSRAPTTTVVSAGSGCGTPNLSCSTCNKNYGEVQPLQEVVSVLSPTVEGCERGSKSRADAAVGALGRDFVLLKDRIEKILNLYYRNTLLNGHFLGPNEHTSLRRTGGQPQSSQQSVADFLGGNRISLRGGSNLTEEQWRLLLHVRIPGVWFHAGRSGPLSCRLRSIAACLQRKEKLCLKFKSTKELVKSLIPISVPSCVTVQEILLDFRF